MATAVRHRLFQLLAAGMALAALYHAVGLFVPINEAQPWRHGLFVLLDMALAYTLLRRPPFLVYLFPVFLLQQYYTHGRRLVRMWAEGGEIDWISVVVLVVLPVVMGLLVAEARERDRRTPRPSSNMHLP